MSSNEKQNIFNIDFICWLGFSGSMEIGLKIYAATLAFAGLDNSSMALISSVKINDN